ncbi:MAG: hypothetical protein ACRDPY_14200 [Streptosporangiaceae bacterium]
MTDRVRRLRSGALTLALAAFVPLAVPAAASASVGPGFALGFPEPGSFVIHTGPGPIVNQVNADSAVSQANVFKVRFQLGVSPGPVVDAVNRSVALTSECSNCNATAIAFQIVTTTEQDLTSLAAINVASATNYECTGTCDAEADAYQLVVATDTPQALPFSGLLNWLQLGALYNVQAQFDALPQSGLDLAQIQAKCEDLVNQAVAILQLATYQPSGPTFSPAVQPGAGTNVALTQSDRPVLKLYHDFQFQPSSGG